MDDFPLKNQLAETVAGVVVREFAAQCACPLEIHTDQGRTLRVNSLNRCVNCSKLAKKRTTSYRPSANGKKKN